MSSLLWVVQNNLYKEEGYNKFLNSLERLECNYIIVKPIPFTNIIIPVDFDDIDRDISEADDPIDDDSQPIMICGAISLGRIAKARGWHPGSFINDNFHYAKWKTNWGDNLLNPDAKIGTVSSFFGHSPSHDVFVRPTEDTKAIAGTVMSKYDFEDWISSVSMVKEEEFAPLHKNTEIAISPIKKIYNECRLFVVDGKVVTASIYKKGNDVIEDSNVDERYISFVNKMTKIWSPSIAFVMDVADTPNGLKIIEINNLNSAGFYACDTSKIINAVEELYA